MGAQYWPFGDARSIAGSASNNLRFPGQYFLVESGLNYNWYRHYDPSTGRYIQADLLGVAQGPSLYGYAKSAPTMLSDKDGRQAATTAGAQIAFPIPIPPDIVPGTPQWWEHFKRGHKGLWNFCRGLFNEEHEEQATRPPPGSKPIKETPWSGDHGRIKGQIGADPNDDVRISPDGNVWAENPDGTWTDFGPASDYTGSGKPSGRRGKDR
ncbi:hypothetical protein H8A95_40480 [Bradyrhizobium sp. Pear76]|uniref:RHS repeat-associated core domain-containing protein n=1 Tax=Bradyrhizobium oropedii TaxID=1571201 RepID=UPI0030844A6E|nr:hypothetical protein [Bradyrhizobium oropedii]